MFIACVGLKTSGEPSLTVGLLPRYRDGVLTSFLFDDEQPTSHS